MGNPETLGTPADRDWPATTTVSAVEVRVADGMTVPLVTTSDGIEENMVPEVVMARAPGPSVWPDPTGDVVMEGGDDGGMVLLLTTSFDDFVRF